ncbi:MAG: hypothetical protein K6U80_08535 [Firmicutes bacterium]|nr:hypothetical protein [Bacillota bacterium]
MLKGLGRLAQSFIRERAFEVEREILARDPEHCEMDKKVKEVLGRIRERLPEEEQGLLVELDEYCHQALAVSHVLMYRAGVADGMKLRRVLRGMG